MVDRIDMALDDIIEATRKNGRDGGAGRKFDRRGGRGGGGGGYRNSRAGGALGSRNLSGAITKPSNYIRGDVDSKWKHDMFNDFGERRIQRGGPLERGGTTTTGPAKLLVSNLDYGVSDSDIRELFSEFGILKSAAVHYDRSGRSLGNADVVFERRSDALKAMNQYNGVPLDGRAMNIQMATSDFRSEERASRFSDGGGFSATRDSSRGAMGGNRNFGGGGRGGFQRGSRGAGSGAGSGARGGRGGMKPTPTAEELDAELDAYVKEIK